MINQQLFDSIKQQLQQGVSKEIIVSNLLSQGWQQQDVDAAFSSVSNSVPQAPSVSQPFVPQPSNTQIISSLPSAGEILKEAWAIYKQRLGIFLGIMAIPALISAIISVVTNVNNPLYLFSLKFIENNFFLFIFLVILLSVVYFIGEALGYIALVYAIRDNQEKISIAEYYKKSWHKIISYWWISFLVVFIILGGFLLLIVPGIIFSIWFSLAIFILINENLKGMDALLKSKEYVKGRFWSVFWRFFFIGILFFLISLAFGFIVLYFSKTFFVLEIGQFIIELFTMPLLMVYFFLVYSKLKALKSEIVFTPTKKSKVTFFVIGILGILFTLTIITLVILELNSAREEARDAKVMNNINNIQNEYVIFPSDYYIDDYDVGDYSIQDFSDKTGRFTPNETEIKEANKLLEEYLDKEEAIRELKEYKVQYVGYIYKDNQKIILANYFCHSSNYDWKEEFVFVLDGGNCFFNVKVNLDKKEVFDFYVNGEV